jgi:hypothetical protein
MDGETLVLFAYIGPETVLPLTSVLAAVAGVFVVFGRMAVRYPVALFLRVVAIIRGRGAVRGPIGRRSAGKVRSDSPVASRPVFVNAGGSRPISKIRD